MMKMMKTEETQNEQQLFFVNGKKWNKNIMRVNRCVVVSNNNEEVKVNIIRITRG